MHGLCKADIVDSILSMVAKMQNVNCVPYIIAFNILINGLFKEGRVHESSRLMAKTIQNHCSWDTIMYNTLVDYLWKTK